MVAAGCSFLDGPVGDQSWLSNLDCDCEEVGDVRSVLSEACDMLLDAVTRYGAVVMVVVVVLQLLLLLSLVLVMDRLSESVKFEFVACLDSSDDGDEDA